jgi:hypothetical protein
MARPAALAFPVYRFPELAQLRGPYLPVLDAQYALMRGDTVQVRNVLEGRRAARAFAAPSDLTLDVLFPEAWLFLQLGDSQSAVAWLDPTLQSLPAAGPQTFADPANAGALVRTVLLRASQGDSHVTAAWQAAAQILLRDGDEFMRSAIAARRASARP